MNIINECKLQKTKEVSFRGSSLKAHNEHSHFIGAPIPRQDSSILDIAIIFNLDLLFISLYDVIFLCKLPDLHFKKRRFLSMLRYM